MSATGTNAKNICSVNYPLHLGMTMSCKVPENENTNEPNLSIGSKFTFHYH